MWKSSATQLEFAASNWRLHCYISIFASPHFLTRLTRLDREESVTDCIIELEYTLPGVAEFVPTLLDIKWLLKAVLFCQR